MSTDDKPITISRNRRLTIITDAPGLYAIALDDYTGMSRKSAEAFADFLESLGCSDEADAIWQHLADTRTETGT